MSRSVLAVEAVHRVPSRPWVFVSGQLTGDPLSVGEQVTVRTPGRPEASAEIRGIEFHNRPGLTTITLDAPLDGLVGPGSSVTVD